MVFSWKSGKKIVTLHERNNTKKNKKKTTMKTYGLLLLFVVVAFVSCGQKQEEEEKIRKVRLETVESGNADKTALYPGTVKAAEDVSLAFRVSGVILRYAAEEGSYVRKGQLIVEMDATDYKVQMDATEAEYQQIKAEASRVMAMYADSVVTPNDYDKAVYGLQQITAKRQHHQDELAYTKLYAPFDGYIQKHIMEAHESVVAGMPVVSMVGNGRPEIEINIPASEYAERDRFTAYSCTFGIYEGVEYSLSLISITPKANNNQLYTMRLAIDTAGKEIPSPGINGTVRISKVVSNANEADKNIDDRETFTISANSILYENGQAWVYVYNQSSTVGKTPIIVKEIKSDGSVVILAEGIKEGDRIVASGVRSVKDGQKVEIMQESSSTNVGGLL